MGSALDKSGNKSSAPRDAAKSTAGQEDSARRVSEREASRRAANMQANHSAIASIRQALQSMPEIADMSRNIVIEPTKDGLNVSLVDEDGRSMFPDASVRPYERTRLVLEVLAPTLRRLPNQISVTGHTAAPRPGSAQAVEAAIS